MIVIFQKGVVIIKMKETYECPHGITQALIGSDHECYCRQCKKIVFSTEERDRKEIVISQLIASNKVKTLTKEVILNI